MLESNTQVLSIKILGLDLTYIRKVMDGNINMLYIKMPTFVMTDSKFIINVRTRQYKSRVFFSITESYYHSKIKAIQNFYKQSNVTIHANYM